MTTRARRKGRGVAKGWAILMDGRPFASSTERRYWIYANKKKALEDCGSLRVVRVTITWEQP